jgi:hypothetical protein
MTHYDRALRARHAIKQLLTESFGKPNISGDMNMNTRTTVAAAIAVAFAIGTACADAQQTYVAAESWTVGPGDYILDDGVPGCGQSSIDIIGQAAQALSAYQAAGIYGALGAVLQTAAQAARPQIGGFIGQVLDSLYGGGRFANCVPVSVVIPAGAQIVGYQFTASDGTGTRQCVIGQDCGIGWRRSTQRTLAPLQSWETVLGIGRALGQRITNLYRV